ncbi:HNH endonuclease [Anabaena sp. WFMT]|uniref:HNH endonuclease n=1 Tax=Anabaena sp. WFMT TaxID=3449730 RepID=UPI003F24B08E
MLSRYPACKKNKCEYYCLSQAGQAATFHIDHIIPVVAGGATNWYPVINVGFHFVLPNLRDCNILHRS